MIHEGYTVGPDRSWGNYDLQGEYDWGVGGLQCSVCGPWAFVGVSYPTFDLAALPDWVRKVKRGPLSIATFERLRETLAPLLGPDRPVVPGVELGRFKGRLRGNVGEFVWSDSWTLFIRESIWHQLNTAGFVLTGQRASITSRAKVQETLVELEILPRARVPKVTLPRPCSVCGRIGAKVPEQVVLDSRSYDPSVPIQRIVELPTIIIVNKELASFVKEQGYRDVILKPIELI